MKSIDYCVDFLLGFVVTLKSLFTAICLVSLVACEQGGTVSGKVEAARQRNQAPPIWVVKDADSTLYLFGTVHLLSPEIEWQKDDIRDVFDAAGTVFFEVDTGERPQIEATVLTTSLGFYSDGRRLSDQLDSYQLKLLEAAANNGMLSLATLDSMTPWLASEFLIVAAGANAGLLPELSADDALKNRAVRLKKNVIYLDTIEDQIRRTADQPDFVHLALLTDTLVGFNSLGDNLTRVAQAWSTGQTTFLTTDIIAAAKRTSPDLYLTLFTETNIKWASKLSQFMEDSGTGFAAIGIGHLLGEDSLQVRLREAGYEVTRYYAFQGENVIRPARIDP